MGAHTGRRHCNTSASTTTRTSAAYSAAAPSRRPPSSPTGINKQTGGDGKVRTTSTRRDVAVRTRMEALRRLVPANDCGGGDRDDELLLRATAWYIVRLQAQVRVMQLMVHVLEHAQD
jgi:hypothetical protein